MLVLKSKSPRRKFLLEGLGLNFYIQPSDVDEDIIANESPLDYLKRVTIDKLEINSVQSQNVYISSDTIVVFQNQLLFKPISLEDAKRILQILNGNVHSVYSGLAIFKNGEVFYDYDETIVRFHSWTNSQIEEYILSAKPFDKAGSYGIQDKNSPVANYEGSFSNVLGFPIRVFYQFHPLWSINSW